MGQSLPPLAGMMAGSCSTDRVINTESGAFLNERWVVKAQILDHIPIDDQ